MQQTALDFPQSLTEKYRPTRVSDFIGLEKPKKLAAKLIANPTQSAWYFLGPSGVGKTTLAQAIANEMPAELHHIQSKECTLEVVKELARRCHYAPRMADTWTPCKMHACLIDEADQMSYAAQLAFLSLLDSTAWPPSTVFIFTGNSTDNLEDRFMSRVHLVEFSSYGLSSEIVNLLGSVWDKESSAARPNLARLAKDACNNVRTALMSLEAELMLA